MSKYFNSVRSTRKYFNSSSSKYTIKNNSTQTVEEKITDLENDLETKGVNVPEAAPRTLWQRIMDVMNVGTYSVANAQMVLNDWNKEHVNTEGKSKWLPNFDYLKQFGNKDLWSQMGSAAWQGLKASNPFGKGNPEYAKTAVDALNQGTWQPHVKDDGNWKVLDANNIARFLTATTADALTSPFSLVDTDAGALFRGSGKGVQSAGVKAVGKVGTKATMRDAAEAAYKAGVDALKNGEAENILRQFGQDVTKQNVDDLIEATSKAAKMSRTGRGLRVGNRVLVSDAKLREIGDKTIAPYVNQILGKISDPISKWKLGTSGNKYFNVSKNVLVKQTARNNPIEYAKVEARKMLQRDNIRKYRDMQNAFAKGAKAMFSGIDEDTQHFMSQLMETSDYMKTMKDVVEGEYKIAFTKEAQGLYDDILKKRSDIEGIINNYKKLNMSAEQLNSYKALDDYLATYTTSVEQGYLAMLENTKYLKNVANLHDVSAINDFFKPFTNKNVDEISAELTLYGFPNPKEAAYEIRHVLDVIQKDIPIDKARKYYTGLEVAGKPISMKYGKPFADDIDNSTKAKLEHVRSQGEKIFKETGNSKYVSEQMEKLLQGYDINPDLYKKYVGEYRKEIQSNNDLLSKLQQRGINRMENQANAQAVKAQRKSLMNQITDMYMKDVPMDNMYQTRRNNILIKLSKKSDDELTKILSSEKGVKDNIINAIDSGTANNMADVVESSRYFKNKVGYAGNAKNTGSISSVDTVRPNTPEAQASFFKRMADGVLATYGVDEKHPLYKEYYQKAFDKLVQMKDDELQEVSDYLATRNGKKPVDLQKYFNKKVSSGFIPNGENVDYGLLNKTRGAKGVDGKYPSIDDNFAKNIKGDFVSELQHEWNIGGVKIYAPIGKDVEVQPLQILNGLNNILESVGKTNNKNYAKVKNALRQMSVYLTDINGDTDAITGSGTVLFGKNIKHNVEKDVFPHEAGHILQQYVKDLLYKEGDDATWKTVMESAQNPMFKNAKYFNSRLASEDNAASFAEFVKNPTGFFKTQPERFKGIMDMLDNVTVKYKGAIDKNEASKSFIMPELSRISLQREIENIKPQIDSLNQKLIDGGVSLDDAIKQKDYYEKLVEHEGNNALFDKVFHDTNGEEAFKTEIVPTQIEVVKKYIDNDTPIHEAMVQRFGAGKEADDATKLIKERMEFVANEFERIGRAENIDKIRPDYVPHMKVTKEIPEDVLKKMKEAGYESNLENIHNLQRKYNMTVDEFNAMVKKNFGVDFDVWENKLGELYLRRGIDSNRMMFMKKDYENIVKNLGIEYTDPKDVPMGSKLFAASEDIRNVLNTKVKTGDVDQLIKDWNIPKEISDDWGRPLVEIDKRVFDELKRANPDFKAFSTSEYVAQMLNKTGQIQADDMRGVMLKAIDGFLQIWKTNVTALNPGFHMSNFMSNQFNMYLSAGAKTLDPHTQAYGALAIGKDENKLSKIMLNLPDGRKMSLADVKRLAVKHGVLEDNRIFNEASAIVSGNNPLADIAKESLSDTKLNKKNIFSKLGVDSFNDKGMAREEIDKLFNEAPQELNANMPKTFWEYQAEVDEMLSEASEPVKENNPLNNLAKSLTSNSSISKKDKLIQALNFASPITKNFAKENSAWAKEWLPYKWSRNIGGAVENQGRMTAFIAHLLNGEKPMEAANNTIKFLFDYSDLTDFEQQIMKRIVPFYTWMRKNIPLQVEQLFMQPEKFRLAGAVTQNIEAMTAPENRIEDKDKNRFAQDYIQLPYTTTNQETGIQEPTFINPRMPYQDLSKISLNPEDIFKTFVSSSNPLLKLPYELTTNLNTYFETPISRGIGDRREAPGYMQLADKLVKTLQGEKQEKPLKIDARLRYILQNTGLLENISKIINADNTRSKEQPLTERDMALASLLIGLKPYSYDVEKYKKWAYKDRLKQLRDLAESLE